MLNAPPRALLFGYPPIAARGPEIQVGVGYSYFSLDVPSSNRANLSGATLAISTEFRPRFGIAADIGYVKLYCEFLPARAPDNL